jgi:hypothetical protein
VNKCLDHRDGERSRGVGSGNCGGEGVGGCGGGGGGVGRVGGGGGVEEGQQRSEGEAGDEEEDEEAMVGGDVGGDAACGARSRFVEWVEEDDLGGDVWIFHALMENIGRVRLRGPRELRPEGMDGSLAGSETRGSREAQLLLGGAYEIYIHVCVLVEVLLFFDSSLSLSLCLRVRRERKGGRELRGEGGLRLFLRAERGKESDKEGLLTSACLRCLQCGYLCAASQFLIFFLFFLT